MQEDKRGGDKNPTSECTPDARDEQIGKLTSKLLAGSSGQV